VYTTLREEDWGQTAGVFRDCTLSYKKNELKDKKEDCGLENANVKVCSLGEISFSQGGCTSRCFWLPKVEGDLTTGEILGEEYNPMERPITKWHVANARVIN